MKNISERDQSKGYIPLRLIIRDYYELEADVKNFGTLPVEISVAS